MSLSAPNFPPTASPPLPPFPATLVIQGSAWRSVRAYGSQAPLFKPATYIGKLSTNDIVLDDPYASRVHAVIYWTATGYEIEDLRSTNGVYVNGARIAGRASLVPGQVIRVGHTDMTFYALQGGAGRAATPGAASQWPAAAPIIPPIPQRAAATTAGAIPIPPPFQHPGVAPSAGSRFQSWFAAEWRKRYWRVFLAGAILLAISEYLLNGPVGSSALFLVVPVAAALMPVTFFIYCWDSDYLADMPRWIPWVTFLSGAALGVTLALVLETIFVRNESFTSAMLVGLIEETCKALAVIWFIFNRKLHSEIDGVILGAAAGAGFATLETIGYALSAYFGGFGAGQGVGALNTVLLLRGLLAIFGHVTWTAIVVGAFWRDRGQRSINLTFGMLFAFATVVILHGLWDGLGVPGMLIAAIIGSWLMRFFLREAVAREKQGASAQVRPLVLALLSYLIHPFRNPLPQAPAPAPAYFSGSWAIAPAPVWAPPAPVMPSGDAQRARYCVNGHLTSTPTANFCRVCGAPLAP
ncbi:MAG TPA: PrsW family glutamic-type intramembrane protease [Ktedonobacterales bacterium]